MVRISASSNWTGGVDEETGQPRGFGGYFEGGKLKYVGSVLDGFPHGIGELRDDGNILYKGSFVYGNFHGNGILYDRREREKFRGEFMNGEFWNGKGYEWVASDERFEYLYHNGVRSLDQEWYDRWYNS